ncbi:RNase adapter RapZ [Sphingomonas sp. HT-1]|uniref:RNase adapter RapZ n=1 Tax=unclassified Sphingomonas TaxID=196159 RepID=UPI0002D67F62|nr:MULTISPECIES: RNase adapter RapZ [unclassified Sphingomonas]KTF69284.1 nucleotide-binding protein [Sphingomonas sp. WG]
MNPRRPKHILLVTGMSGAGKSTVLRTLEDLGWEVVDNLPLLLLNRLLDTAPAEAAEGDDQRPLALGIGTQTRGFDPESVVQRIKKLREEQGHDVGTLFLECAGAELVRRYSETRRRHPLAQDRPAVDGIARERELLGPLRRWSNRLIDTTDMTANALAQAIRAIFSADGTGKTTFSVTSFGFSRGLPRDADLVLDMRFLRNPHWDAALRPGTGRDADVSAYIAADPAYDAAMEQIESLLLLLLPRYQAEGKSYVTIAFGCTGGRHRSVHVAERVARRLRAAGFSPTVTHRDLQTAPQDSLEGAPVTIQGGGEKQ